MCVAELGGYPEANHLANTLMKVCVARLRAGTMGGTTPLPPHVGDC